MCRAIFGDGRSAIPVIDILLQNNSERSVERSSEGSSRARGAVEREKKVKQITTASLSN